MSPLAQRGGLNSNDWSAALQDLQTRLTSTERVNDERIRVSAGVVGSEGPRLAMDRRPRAVGGAMCIQ